MKRNLDKEEYLRQMKILDILSDSDIEKDAEEIDWKIKVYKEF
jgi:hypothetical protein